MIGLDKKQDELRLALGLVIRLIWVWKLN